MPSRPPWTRWWPPRTPRRLTRAWRRGSSSGRSSSVGETCANRADNTLVALISPTSLRSTCFQCPRRTPQRTPRSPLPNPAKAAPRCFPKPHNDDVNEFAFVTRSVVEFARLSVQDAMDRTVEAHEAGVAMLLVTHRERAELIQDQFQTRGVTVTIEPAP
ncbi:MAG: hypothetical protein EBU31_08000 [Proteobacteria bacterium]|nr:hypothetical protein [Pseudomonadota bacterium]